MNIIKFLFFAFLGLALVLTSCNKEDGANDEGDLYTGSNCYDSWGNAIAVNSTKISEAYQVYYSNQSVENCNKLKAVYQDYVNALRPYQNCSGLYGVERQEFIDGVNELEAEIETICD